MLSLLIITTYTLLLQVTYSFSYGCFMDGCNPQRTFNLGAAPVPYKNKQSLNVNWIFTSFNLSYFSNDTNSIIDNGFPEYLGCATNDEDGIIISCLFKNQGLFTLNTTGDIIWSYSDPIVSSQISNISSVPLLLPGSVTIIDTGIEIMAFEDGIFDWQELVANLSIPSNTLSKYSVGFVDPQYFSISLGDGRFSVYDYSQGMCWASLYLTYKYQQYTPIAVTSSVASYIYVIGLIATNMTKCAIFAFQIGNIQYRLQTRWIHEYHCNQDIGHLGMAVIIRNDSIPFPIGTIITYSLDNDTNKIGISAIRDESEHRSQYLWTMNVNQYCGMGYLIDPRQPQSFWICDYFQNNILLLKGVNATNGIMISDININDILFHTFSISDNWKSVLSVNISSRGVSGVSSDSKHYVIVLCVNVVYRNQDNNITESNILTIVDIEGKYLLSWYIFETATKCVGQISATTDGKLIIPLQDGMSVIALST